MHPEEVPTAQLLPGQVGYIACNMKQSSEGEILNSAHQLTSRFGRSPHW
jgi:translation factor GUF1, mitochondrial